MWECGLKHPPQGIYYYRSVTPHVGVWIETIEVQHLVIRKVVTPHVGVWIETYGN